MRWVVIVLGSLAAVVAILLAVGYSLPVKHVATRSAVVAAPADQVWAAITDVASAPQWRTDVKSVEVVRQGAAGPVWREVSGDGTITFETVESLPPRRLVTRIADKSLPFGGRWTYELEPTTGGTRVTIREDGEVYNPVFRFVSRYVMGHHATIEKYLTSLRTRLGASG
ncbi:MAG TPA: SRPBCC family protein [Gemmatimonadaceae bacterium]|nr:SRPBCC family protein [Gemmatimonadaceae bacterium]